MDTLSIPPVQLNKRCIGEEDTVLEQSKEEVLNFKQEEQRLTHQDAPGEQDAVLEELQDEVSNFKQEVQWITHQDAVLEES